MTPTMETQQVSHTTGPLQVRYYWPSAAFRAIAEHVCVARPDGTPVALCGPAGDPASEADARLFVVASGLLESLDNVTAALETVLAHYGPKMPPADLMARSALVLSARDLIAKARNGN